MLQYGLRTAEGSWLPRDGYKRGTLRVRLNEPDLWQDQERAILYASQYSCDVVAFVVAEALVSGKLKEDEAFCGAV